MTATKPATISTNDHRRLYSPVVVSDKGIAGHTPARRAAIGGSDSPCDTPDVPMGNGVTVSRHMGPHGATVFRLDFNSPDLQALLARVSRSECIPIRMDPADTSTIYVRDADAWLAVPCVSLPSSSRIMDVTFSPRALPMCAPHLAFSIPVREKSDARFAAPVWFLKRSTKRLRRALRARGHDLPYTRCLDLIARLYGYSDYPDFYRSASLEPLSKLDHDLDDAALEARFAHQELVMTEAGFGPIAGALLDEVDPTDNKQSGSFPLEIQENGNA